MAANCFIVLTSPAGLQILYAFLRKRKFVKIERGRAAVRFDVAHQKATDLFREGAGDKDTSQKTS